MATKKERTLTTVEILKEMAFTATETQRRALEDAISALSTEGDLISRQAVDDVIYDYSRSCDVNYAQIMEYIDKIPSVENKGEWIKIQSGDKDFPESIVCSKCKNENSHLDFNEHGEPIGKVFVTSKFCPNCGARMKGGE